MLSINKNYRSRQQVARSLPLHVIPSKDSFVLGKRTRKVLKTTLTICFAAVLTCDEHVRQHSSRYAINVQCISKNQKVCYVSQNATAPQVRKAKQSLSAGKQRLVVQTNNGMNQSARTQGLLWQASPHRNHLFGVASFCVTI